jgi:signal transduction histidine kinase/streptogramin lyase
MVAILRLVCFIVILHGSTLTIAQTYKITWYNSKDSLPGGAVNSITQDSTGFIWIGTDNGLFRYTGKHFLRLAEPRFSCVNTFAGRIYPGNRHLYRVDARYPFITVSLARTAITSTDFISKDQVLFTGNDEMWWSDRGKVHRYSNGVTSVYAIPLAEKIFLQEVDGTVIAASFNGGVFFFSADQFVPLTSSLHREEINSIITYKSRWLILATETRLLLLKPRDGRVDSVVVLDNRIGYRKVAADGEGNIWAAGTDNRIYKFYPDKGSFVRRNVSDGTEPHRISDLIFPSINELFIDRHNNVWVAHHDGLALVSEIAFVIANPQLPNEIIRTAAFVDEGKAYLSGIAGFFETVSKGHNEYELRPAPFGLTIYPNALCKCGDRLWFGSMNDEIFYLEDNQLSSAVYSKTAGNIFYMFCDKNEDVWVSRGQKYERVYGILKISKDLKAKEYNDTCGFSTRMLVTKADVHGNVYVAGIGDATYLYRYNREKDKFENLSLPMAFDYGENFEVHDFIVAPDTTFWLASTGGLLRQKGNRIERIEVPELFGREAVAVTLAEDNTVWVSTEKDGLVRFDADGRYARFDIHAGLQSGIMWYRSLFTDGEGKIWAGSREGITVSIRSSPKAKTTEKPILLSVTGTDDGALSQEVFAYHSSIEASFVSLVYPTRSITYQYSIDNHQREWRDLRSETTLGLPILEPGRHTLYVRARQVGGYYWSEPMVYSFTILPPWYRSGAAWLVYAVMLVLAMVFSIRIYNRRLIREKYRLEEKVKERTSELVRKQEEIIAQNQELHQLSDVLAANNESIVRQKEIIQQQNLLLSQAKSDLEKKVQERTQELKITNEELAQQNVQLEQFAFMTAHNLRAPVARLLGLTSLLEIEGPLDAGQVREILKRIRESSKNLDETIKEISEILHIKKGLQGSFISVSLHGVWTRIYPSFEQEIQENGIQVKANFGEHHIVKGIEPYIYSVFYNIISNSIKYADHRKSPFIHACVSQGNEIIIVNFEDNGIGFNSDQFADKLFKPFTRFNNTKEGRGLGLYLMKIQMEMMEGSIELHSKADEGTRITLRFQKAR